MAVLTALAVGLALAFHIPIIPQVYFLEYDMADVPIFLCTFMYGPFAGIIVTVIVSVIQGFTVSASGTYIGVIMHILATGSYVIVSGIIYSKHKSFKGALVAIASGMLTWMVLMILWNIIITPFYLHIPHKLIFNSLGFIIAFNAVKVTANSLLTLLLYKRLRHLFSYIFKTDRFEKKNKKFEINSSVCEFVTHSVKETEKLAAALAEKLKGGEVILLNGRLGAGKTAFTKGLAKALGIKGNVTSPTFTIMKEYRSEKFNLCHFDMYRIESSDELEELGLRELLYDDKNVCVIEWNKFDGLRDVINVDIEYLNEKERKFSFNGIKL
jgi:tRNA threonylcarbamoyl adenosine modification protein YjeE